MEEFSAIDYRDVPKDYTGIVIYPDGTKEWYLNGKRHNENGPAVISGRGTKVWYLNGKRHNENGPAVVCPNGIKEWYLNGKRLSEGAFKTRTHKPKEI